MFGTTDEKGLELISIAFYASEHFSLMVFSGWLLNASKENVIILIAIIAKSTPHGIYYEYYFTL